MPCGPRRCRRCWRRRRAMRRGDFPISICSRSARRSRAACRKRKPPTRPASSPARASAIGASRAMPPICSTPRRRLLAALEAAMGGPMTAPVTAGAPAWFHPGRSGTIALGPKAACLVRRTASQNLGGVRSEDSGGGFRDQSSTPSPSPKPKKARAAFVALAFPGYRARFRFCGGRQSGGRRDRQGRQKWRTAALIESVSVFDVYEGKSCGRRQEIHRHRRARPAQGQDPDGSRDRGAGGKDCRCRHQSDRSNSS